MANKSIEFDKEMFPNYRSGENSNYYEERCPCEDGCEDCQGTGWVPRSVYVSPWIRFLKWLVK